jgi:hypothetical protein
MGNERPKKPQILCEYNVNANEEAVPVRDGLFLFEHETRW